jgi:hypothetical protein
VTSETTKTSENHVCLPLVTVPCLFSILFSYHPKSPDEIAQIAQKSQNKSMQFHGTEIVGKAFPFHLMEVIILGLLHITINH